MGVVMYDERVKCSCVVIISCVSSLASFPGLLLVEVVEGLVKLIT